MDLNKEKAMRLDTPEGPLPAKAPSRRLVSASIFTAGYAVAAASASADPIVTSDEGLLIEEVTFPGAGDYALPAYVASPRHANPGRSGRHPAIIVVNEVFGIHAYIKDICKRLAQQGYLAIAPDYFDRAGDPSTLADFAQIRTIVDSARHEQVMGDTEGAIRFLKRRGDVNDSRIGITGFCWGGSVVWMAAARFHAIKAGVAWYGRLTPREAGTMAFEAGRPWPVDIAGQLHAPVLGLYAEHDQGIPLPSVEAMRAALAVNHNPTHSEIIVYPDAQHGFHADYRESYNSAAAQDGWTRMLAWFRANGVG
jgi:carboxymethylenebutenolidase